MAQGRAGGAHKAVSPLFLAGLSQPLWCCDTLKQKRGCAHCVGRQLGSSIFWGDVGISLMRGKLSSLEEHPSLLPVQLLWRSWVDQDTSGRCEANQPRGIN